MPLLVMWAFLERSRCSSGSRPRCSSVLSVSSGQCTRARCRRLVSFRRDASPASVRAREYDRFSRVKPARPCVRTPSQELVMGVTYSPALLRALEYDRFSRVKAGRPWIRTPPQELVMGVTNNEVW